MNDDIERTLRDSLDRHAAGADTMGGHLDDVYRRVDRRATRRRSLAVIASVAALTGGVIGFAMFAAGGGNEMKPESAASGDDVTTTTSWSAYACTGYLGSQDIDGSGPRDVYSDCVPIDYSPAIIETSDCVYPTTIPVPTVPMTTMSTTSSSTTTTTTVPVTGLPAGDATAEAVVCGQPAPNAPPECFAPTTMPATTTTFAASIVTAPGSGSTAVDAVACSTYTPETAPPTLPPEISPVEQAYVVVAGDSLTSIASVYRITVDTLVNYNDWPEGVDHPVFVGDVVMIPPNSFIP